MATTTDPDLSVDQGRRESDRMVHMGVMNIPVSAAAIER